ncbi:tRNA (cytidine(34)-2'-O)-methyltransferase [Baaleninema sp.]|uniref:tRNA (cytidine(34)-2'-O)-methyltransferase n=1 Tax=Baaleninema sp. TaxID=3101197 RepID=UPI003D00956B
MPNLVLVNPQIPPNTGNIARTCAATQTPLHLVGPLGFELSDRYLKRAGLDYWPYVTWHYHETLEQFRGTRQSESGRWIGFSTRGRCSYTEFEFRSNDWLLFGSETEGLSSETLEDCDETVFIPMLEPRVRSLNLSVSAALGLFECLRQTNRFRDAPSPKGNTSPSVLES